MRLKITIFKKGNSVCRVPFFFSRTNSSPEALEVNFYWTARSCKWSDRFICKNSEFARLSFRSERVEKFLKSLMGATWWKITISTREKWSRFGRFFRLSIPALKFAEGPCRSISRWNANISALQQIHILYNSNPCPPSSDSVTLSFVSRKLLCKQDCSPNPPFPLHLLGLVG